MVLNQKIPERKNLSQSIHNYGSKPENTRKKKICHIAYTIMVLNPKYQKGKIGHREYIKEGLFEKNSWIWKQGHR